MTLPEWISIPNLAGCRLKIERADEHIDNLKVAVAAFLKENPQRIVGNIDDKTGHYVLTAKGTSDTTRLAVLAGEIFYQLRSSLDHLMWQLVVIWGNRPTARTSFPVYTFDPVNDPRALKRYEGKIEGISSNAKALVREHQPYNGLKKDSPLAIINEMNIVDKHRTLLVVVTSVKFPTIRFSNQFMTAFDYGPESVVSEAKNEAEVGRIVPLMGNMNVQVSTSFDVAFSHVGLRRNEAIIPTLKSLRDATSEIINAFRSEFR